VEEYQKRQTDDPFTGGSQISRSEKKTQGGTGEVGVAELKKIKT